MRRDNSNKQSDKNVRIISFLVVVLTIVLLIYFLFVKNGIKLEAGGFKEFFETTLENPGSELSGKLDQKLIKQKAEFLPSEEVPSYNQPMLIRILDAEHGPCVLIQDGTHYAIYDGGGEETSTDVLNYIQKMGIEHIDYLFVPYFDKDHIGRITGLLDSLEIDQIVCPDYSDDTETCKSFIVKATNSGVTVIHPPLINTLVMNNTKFIIAESAGHNNKDKRIQSLVINISYGIFNCQVIDDAKVWSETKLVKYRDQIESDVLVIGHQGSRFSASEKIIKYVDPNCVILNNGDNESGYQLKKLLNVLG